MAWMTWVKYLDNMVAMGGCVCGGGCVCVCVWN